MVVEANTHYPTYVVEITRNIYGINANNIVVLTMIFQNGDKK